MSMINLKDEGSCNCWMNPTKFYRVYSKDFEAEHWENQSERDLKHFTNYDKAFDYLGDLLAQIKEELFENIQNYSGVLEEITFKDDVDHERKLQIYTFDIKTSELSKEEKSVMVK